MKIQNHTLIIAEESDIDILNGTCTIPEEVTHIGKGAFFKCKNLVNIILPDGIISIGNCAFYGCRNLESITLPDSLTSIGSCAFSWCKSLKNVTLPDGLTSISEYAFYGCENLESVILPDSLTSIGKCAFDSCMNLKNIALPNNVTNIGNCALYGCESLESITIPDSVTYIGNNAFYGCRNLKSIILPDNLTDIGDGAFYGCESLESVILPDSLTSIGIHTFNYCENLTQIQWGKVSYPVKCIDGSCMYLLQTKELRTYTVYKCQYFPKMNKIVWIAEKDGITAHGASVKAAIRDVDFKLLENRDVSEHIARIQSQGYVTPMDYRLITGACEEGTDEFLKLNHLSWNDKRTIQEVIELTEGEYGHETFIKALKDSGCIS